MRINLSFINVYKKKNLKSKVVTQLLYGDTFKVLKKYNSWIKIKNDLDSYKGFIKNRNFPANHKSTHKVFNLRTKLYTKPHVKNKIKKELSFGSRIKVIEKKNNFCKFDNLWVKKKDLKKIDYKTKNSFKDIKKFLNVKYKWGGKSYKGIDCSALIQVCLNFNNRFCPRDTKDQIRYFKKNVKSNNIKKNDLIYWKGHVALALSKYQLIHAYGPLKKTVIMGIDRTLQRIENTANLKLKKVKRVK